MDAHVNHHVQFFLKKRQMLFAKWLKGATWAGGTLKMPLTDLVETLRIVAGLLQCCIMLTLNEGGCWMERIRLEMLSIVTDKDAWTPLSCYSPGTVCFPELLKHHWCPSTSETLACHCCILFFYVYSLNYRNNCFFFLISPFLRSDYYKH